MVHGDASGLVMPPRVAPIQVVVVPIYRSNQERDDVARFVAEIEPALRAAFRIEIDWREEYTPGYKFADWELRGVPVRMEVGPRDVRNGQVVLVRRDIREKTIVARDSVVPAVGELLNTVQQALFARATAFRQANSENVTDLVVFEEMMNQRRGFAHSQWCGSADCEAMLKERTSATIRNLPLDVPPPDGGCLYCGRPAKHRVVLAKAY
jgi:prolyl-tRNA synthetase